MKQLIFLITLLLSAFMFISCSPDKDISKPTEQNAPNNGSITITFVPNDTDLVYAAWIEDLSGNVIQRLYICDRLIDGSLTGDALPIHKKSFGWKYGMTEWTFPDVDAVTGASMISQSKINEKKLLNTGEVRKFRVCFEVDRSRNDNDYFYDRPSFFYKSGEIDLDNLQSPYDLAISGWMSNDTTGTSYGQQPKTPPGIPGFQLYELSSNLKYIKDSKGNNDDMVKSLSVTITAN